MSKYKYYIFNKPYFVLSQFTQDVEGQRTLKDYLDIEKDVYPVGRLDKDSEGFLLLTNDSDFKNHILNPKKKTPKTYTVQVDGEITEKAIQQLRKGIKLRIKKKEFTTLPAKVVKIDPPPIEERDPPVRFRKEIPTSWIKITLIEGKNRQVRKMGAAVGFPVLRLIRTDVGGLEFQDVQIGKFRSLTKEELIALRK